MHIDKMRTRGRIFSSFLMYWSKDLVVLWHNENMVSWCIDDDVISYLQLRINSNVSYYLWTSQNRGFNWVCLFFSLWFPHINAGHRGWSFGYDLNCHLHFNK